MLRGLGLVVVALLIAGCATGVTPSVKTSTSAPAPTFIRVSQPFRLFTHCGILTTEIAGRTFYPFAVHVLSGGNTLIDEQFAGRHWHTTETLPGVKGPTYGNGRD